MLIPRSLSRSKILILVVVLILTVGGGLYLTFNYLLPSSNSTVNVSVDKSDNSSFGPELEAALSLPEPATVFNPAWFDESLIKQLQNNGTLPIKVGQAGKADPFAPLSSTLKKR